METSYFNIFRLTLYDIQTKMPGKNGGRKICLRYKTKVIHHSYYDQVRYKSILFA